MLLVTKFAWRLEVYTGKRRQKSCAWPHWRFKWTQHNVLQFLHINESTMELKKQNLTKVGTIISNKTFLHPINLSSKSDSKYSSRFLYNENSQILLISYKPIMPKMFWYLAVSIRTKVLPMKKSKTQCHTLH